MELCITVPIEKVSDDMTPLFNDMNNALIKTMEEYENYIKVMALAPESIKNHMDIDGVQYLVDFFKGELNGQTN